MKKQSFFGGVFVLLFCGIVAKGIGAIYKIPLTLILGVEGLGIYQLVFPLFSFALTISSSAMPTALSRIISSKNLDDADAKKVLGLSFKFLLLFSACFSILIFVLSDTLSSLQGNPMASKAFKAISPAVLFVSVIAAFRGYFQGKLNMTPTALSHIFEQGFKLLFALFLGYALLRFGVDWGAFGALLGIGISEFLTAIFLWILFLKEKPKKKVVFKRQNNALLKPLLKSFFMIGVFNIILPLSVFLDSILVLNLLQNAGHSIETATSLWGIESGIVASITNLPAVFGLAITNVLVPNIAKDKQNNRKQIFQSFFLTLLFSIPFFVVLLMESGDITNFLFSQNFDKTKLDVASNLLFFASAEVVLFSILQTQNATLQGLGKFFVPLLSMGLGFFVKTILFVFLVQNQNFGIFGVEISKYAFFGVAILLNYVYFKRKGIKMIEQKSVLPIFLSSFLMLSIFAIMNHFEDFFGFGITLIFKLFVGFLVFVLAYFLVSFQNLPKKFSFFLRKIGKKRTKIS